MSTLLTSALIPFLIGAATGGWWSRRRAVSTAVAAAVAEATATASARAGHVVVLGGPGGSHDPRLSSDDAARVLQYLNDTGFGDYDDDDDDDDDADHARSRHPAALNPARIHYLDVAANDDDHGRSVDHAHSGNHGRGVPVDHSRSGHNVNDVPGCHVRSVRGVGRSDSSCDDPGPGWRVGHPRPGLDKRQDGRLSDG